MKILATISILIVSLSNLIAQTVELTSVFSIETDDIYSQNNSVIYKDSFVYTIGDFQGSLSSLGTTLSTNYSRGIYLLKTTTSNDFVWLKKIADNDYDVAQAPTFSIDLDSTGNVFTAIGFRDRLYFNNDSAFNLSSDFQGTVVMKLNNQGIYQWNVHFEGIILGTNGIAIDHNNIILLTGKSNDDFILKKFDSIGNTIFTKSGGGLSLPDGGIIVKIDEFNNYYCAGRLITANNIYFDAINPTFSQSGVYGSFVVKYNSDGDVQWLKCYSSSSFGNFGSITNLDIKDGQIIVGGTFNSLNLLTFPNEGTVGPNNSQDRYGGFLFSYDYDGNLNWKRKTHITSNGDDGVNCTSIGENGHVYAISSFDYTMLVGDSNLYAGELGGLLLEKYSPEGDLLWFYLIEGQNIERGFMLKNIGNTIYLFGTSASTPLNFGVVNFAPISIPSLFIAKLQDTHLGTSNLQDFIFSAFPNPTHDYIKIKSDHDLSGLALIVYNQSAQVITSYKLNNPHVNSIELPSEKGVYFIKIGGIESNFLRIIKI